MPFLQWFFTQCSELPLNLSDTAATSQDGSSLEFIAAIVGRQCYIQDASGRGLCKGNCTIADLRYGGKDIMSPSTLIIALIKS